MWSNQKQHDAFVITITPRIITYSHLYRPGKKALIQLKSFHNQTCDTLELEKLIVFNPTTITKQITAYYQAIGNRAIPVLLALNGPSLYTKIISTSDAHPSLEQFNLPRTPHLQWAYRYLYSHDNRHYFYVCGLPQQILLQFQLITINAQIPLRLLSTEHMALLYLYRHLAGKTFRHSTLGKALIERNNTIEQLFSEHDLSQVLSVSTSSAITEENQIPLLAACGLFVSEGWK